jgi:uncharacterized protein involved in exopolysaccharide biosynthesis
MELLDISRLLIRNIKWILISALIGALIGLFIQSLPRKFVAQGTLFVTRSVQSNSDQFFGYEGYYAQQAANSYTNTAMALAESIDVRQQVMKKLGVEINDLNIFEYGKLLRVKKAGPQVLTLTFKSDTAEKALKSWTAAAESIVELNSSFNQQGDAQLHIVKVAEPVIKKNYFYPWQFALAGAVLFSGLYFTWIVFRSYLAKESK